MTSRAIKQILSQSASAHCLKRWSSEVLTRRRETCRGNGTLPRWRTRFESVKLQHRCCFFCFFYAALALPCNTRSSRLHAKWFMYRPMTRRCSLSYLGFSFFVCSEHITVTLGKQTTAVCCFGILLSRKRSKLPARLGVFVLTAAFRRKNWPRLERRSGSGKGPLFWSQHLSFSINQRAKDDEVCQLRFVWFCFFTGQSRLTTWLAENRAPILSERKRGFQKAVVCSARFFGIWRISWSVSHVSAMNSGVSWTGMSKFSSIYQMWHLRQCWNDLPNIAACPWRWTMWATSHFSSFWTISSLSLLFLVIETVKKKTTQHRYLHVNTTVGWHQCELALHYSGYSSFGFLQRESTEPRHLFAFRYVTTLYHMSRHYMECRLISAIYSV